LFLCRIIESIETYASLIPVDNQTSELLLNRENFALLITESITGEIPGGDLIQAGSGVDVVNEDIDFTQVEFSSSGSSSMTHLASVVITQELIEIFQNSTPVDEPPRIIFVVYGVNCPLFQDPVHLNGTGGVIVSALQSPIQSLVSVEDLEEPVNFQFRTNKVVPHACIVFMKCDTSTCEGDKYFQW
jgi:hypothetical protein